MANYLKCTNCGKVVLGFEAAMQTECCENPKYEHTDNPLADGLSRYLGFRPVTTVEAPTHRPH